MDKSVTPYCISIPTNIYEHLLSTTDNADLDKVITGRLEATIKQDKFTDIENGYATILTEFENLQAAYNELLQMFAYNNIDPLDQDIWSKVEHLLSLVEDINQTKQVIDESVPQIR